MLPRHRAPLCCVVLAAALAGSCGPRTPPAAAVERPPDKPILAAPEADLYAAGTGHPRDFVVAGVVQDRAWDEALSGAAGALALAGDEDPSLPVARWAAYRAGYPYLVTRVIVGDLPADADPSGLADAIDAQLGPGMDLGLARARVGERDHWVALLAKRPESVPPFAREYDKGQTLEVDLESGLGWVLVSPRGDQQDGTGQLRRALLVEGEWWLQVERAGKPLISVPIYVDMTIPPTPPIGEDTQLPGTPSEAAGLALAHLQDMRDELGLAVPQPDATLRTLAAAPLADLRAGRFDPEAGAARLRGAGFVGGPADALGCIGVTVADCLNALAMDADDRAALLDPGHRVVGIAADLRTKDVALVVHLASE